MAIHERILGDSRRSSHCWISARQGLLWQLNRNQSRLLSSTSSFQIVTVRSTDRGRSWSSDNPGIVWDATITDPAASHDGAARLSDLAPIDFTDSDVLVSCYSVPRYGLPTDRAWVRVSKNAGQTWSQPMLLPLAGLPSLAGTNSSIVRHDGRSLIFSFTVSPDGWTRRPVVYASLDGGTAWTFLSFITPRRDDGATASERAGSVTFAAHRWFYPRALLLPDGRILCSLRCQRDPTGVMWTEIYESSDGGRTWRFVSRVNDWGAPGSLTRMKDGRIVCVYGYRLPPYGIRARVSEDDGRTWGPDIILRDDGGSWDLGYPNAIEQEPGKILTIYYFNSKDDPIQMNGGVRHIAQTVFTPN